MWNCWVCLLHKGSWCNFLNISAAGLLIEKRGTSIRQHIAKELLFYQVMINKKYFYNYWFQRQQLVLLCQMMSIDLTPFENRQNWCFLTISKKFLNFKKIIYDIEKRVNLIWQKLLTIDVNLCQYSLIKVNWHQSQSIDVNCRLETVVVI